jgi:hypothetical protein
MRTTNMEQNIFLSFFYMEKNFLILVDNYIIYDLLYFGQHHIYDDLAYLYQLN